MAGQSIDERLRELAARKAKIEMQLRALADRKATRDRKLDTRRKIIVGASVLGAAEASRHHREWLLDVLRKAPFRTHDAPIIEQVIGALENLQSDP